MRAAVVELSLRGFLKKLDRSPTCPRNFLTRLVRSPECPALAVRPTTYYLMRAGILDWLLSNYDSQARFTALNFLKTQKMAARKLQVGVIGDGDVAQVRILASLQVNCGPSAQ